MPTTYAAHNIAKAVGSHFVPGAGDAASAISAEAKALALGDILQEYFQARTEEFDGTSIGPTDVKKAILYARGKKHTKAIRKGVLSTSKFGLSVAATVGGATVGSVVPVLGTALGAVGGLVAGASLSAGVSIADRLKRSVKGIYKHCQGTRGVHREEAAATLMRCSDPRYNRAHGGNPARDALVVILQEEYDTVMKDHDVKRLAARLKSN